MINILNRLESQKNIKFKLMSIDEAESTLLNRTNYYKISCFKKNFTKDANGKYIDLDFATLYDLSIIDSRLRDILLKMSIDLEHHLKRKIIHFLTTSINIRHTSIFNRFDSYLRQEFTSDPANAQRQYKTLFNKILPRTTDQQHYDYLIYSKYGTGAQYSRLRSNLPIWVLMEKLTSGQLAKFLDFYKSQTLPNYAHFDDACNTFKNIVKIRNASAHNRPIIFNLVEPQQFGGVNHIPIFIERKIRENFPKNSSDVLRKINNYKFLDILTLIYLFDSYVESNTLKYARKEELLKLIRRIRENRNFYLKHNELKNLFFIFEKLIKNF